jgi:ribosome-binding protein aMBF1 (putative translation factor)
MNTRLAKGGRNMSDQNTEDYLRAKEPYKIICNHELGDDSSGVQQRVAIIRELESITGKDFRNTAEFHREVQAFIEKKGERVLSLGVRLKKARKKKGWTQKQLADHLGFKAHSTFIMYEQNKRIPPKEVLEWLLREEKALGALPTQNVTPLSNWSNP